MRLRLILSLIFLLVSTTTPASYNVIYKLGSGVEATARYMPGDEQKPVVLLLHGFLSTNNFNTILSLGHMLHTQGYNVLAPTLTLGINRRHTGLSCEAIHTSTINDDVLEISDWVNWLVKKGHKNIVLLGHSQGSLTLLVYTASANIHHQVKLIIPSSLTYIDAGANQQQQRHHLAMAKKAIKNNSRQPGIYSLSYCKNDFVATPRAYLSFMHWGNNQVVAAIEQTTIPVHVIMGSRDRYLNRYWKSRLQNSNARLSIVDNASHFYDGEEEIDYHKMIISILEKNKY